MQSMKPGRGPSALGGTWALFGVVFGIGWTVFAFYLTQNFPFPIGIVFPLFGVLMVLICLVQAVYHFRNAAAKNRNSLLDLTTSQEEPDPLNQYFDRLRSQETDLSSTEAKLARLQALREKELITESEYTIQRRRILDQI